MKKVLAFATTASFMVLGMQAQAIDLGVDIGLGGTNVGVGVSVGHGSLASVGIGVSHGNGEETASAPDAGNPGSGTSVPGTDPSGLQLPPELLAKYVGKSVFASDGMLLGQVITLKPAGAGGCPVLGIAPNPELTLEYERVWLRMESCNGTNSRINLAMSGAAFVASLTR
jgi:hypothetical protein